MLDNVLVGIEMDVISAEQFGLIQKVDFEKACNFLDGKCNKMQTGGTVCCSKCYRFVGYLKVHPHELPPEYAILFDRQTGFLGEHGCKLPPEKRSVTCSCYICEQCDISSSDRELLVQIRNTKK